MIHLRFRAHLLKQQRLERHKSAVERRHRLEDKQRQRWRHSGHYACAQGELLEFVQLCIAETKTNDFVFINVSCFAIVLTLGSLINKNTKASDAGTFRLRFTVCITHSFPFYLHESV